MVKEYLQMQVYKLIEANRDVQTTNVQDCGLWCLEKGITYSSAKFTVSGGKRHLSDV